MRRDQIWGTPVRKSYKRLLKSYRYKVSRLKHEETVLKVGAPWAAFLKKNQIQGRANQDSEAEEGEAFGFGGMTQVLVEGSEGELEAEG